MQLCKCSTGIANNKKGISPVPYFCSTCKDSPTRHCHCRLRDRIYCYCQRFHQSLPLLGMRGKKGENFKGVGKYIKKERKKHIKMYANKIFIFFFCFCELKIEEGKLVVCSSPRKIASKTVVLGIQKTL